MNLTVRAHEQGMIRLFALSMTEDEAKPLRADPNAPDPARSERLAALLGVKDLDPDGVEVFAVADLEDLGLAGYMIEGNGVDARDIDPDRAKLAALDGWVMVVYSKAFAGEEATLRPAPQLTLIATYSEPGTDWSASKPLTSTSAARQATDKKQPSDAAMAGRVATIALLVLFALTAVVIWVAG